jgi:hypothetical protein
MLASTCILKIVRIRGREVREASAERIRYFSVRAKQRCIGSRALKLLAAEIFTARLPRSLPRVKNFPSTH